MVFEDDAVFVPDFERKYQAFLEELPCDWDMFYLGGQLLHTQHAYAIPEKVSEHVYRPYNVNRTHCFAVNSSGYKYLYDFLLRRFENNEWHIDHHLGRLHEQAVLNVYCSATWLVGQREGSSNIDGKTRETDVFFPSAKFYHKTSLEYSPYCVVLFTSEEVARELTAKHHWHSGFSKDDRFIDKGLKNIYRDTNLKLRQWYYYIRRECMQKNFVPFLWHPHLKEEDFKTLSLPFKPIYITALTAEEAVECLKSETL
jgi:GR25 family glycosyltransferase involved in LPS biosynthesis